VAFTYNLSTDIGRMRLELADTGGVGPGETAAAGTFGFHDAELQYFLDQAGSVASAITLALLQLLTDGARRERAYTVSGTNYDDRGRVAALERALKLRGYLPAASVITPAALSFDSGYVEQPVILTS
jgi:hypothetical protein